MKNQIDDNDYWKGVILYGLNQATYKIALGKSNMGKSLLLIRMYYLINFQVF